MSSIIAIPSDYLEAGVPAQPLAVWAFLCWRDKASAAEVAAHYGCVRQTAWAWLRDLYALGLVEKVTEGRSVRYRPIRNKTLTSLARRDDGRIRRCSVCRRPNQRGRWCPKCKQTHGREDRKWVQPAIRLLKQGVSPRRAQVLLGKEGLSAPLYDHVPPGQDLTAPGIISIGLIHGCFSEDEARREKQRQEAYFGGASEDFDEL